MVGRSSVGSEPRERLRGISKALQELHRTLLDFQRREYEKSFGRIGSDFYVLKLAADDPQFAWLRALSAEMMRIDIARSGGIDETDLRLAGTRLRFLLTPDAEGTPFQVRYDEAMQTNPSIIMAHAAVMRALPPARRVLLFRSDPPAPMETSDTGVETRLHRPGKLVPGHGDRGYRTLAAIVEAGLPDGAFPEPHRYANEDIILWTTHGAVEHVDAAGATVHLDRDHLAVINAGTGAEHADRAARGAGGARLVQVAVRPPAIHGEPAFQHGALPAADGEWRELAGPEGEDAPFSLRNALVMFDLALPAGEAMGLPRRDGWDTCLFVAEGEVAVDDVPVGSSMTALLLQPGPARLVATEDALVAALLIDPAAKVTRAGTIGR